MTKKQRVVVDEYKARLLEQCNNGDNEIAHSIADDLLLEALRKLGFGELSDAWKEVQEKVGGFWYA